MSRPRSRGPSGTLPAAATTFVGVNTGTDDVAEALAGITGGRRLDHAMDTTAVPALVRVAVDALGVRGSCAVIGAPPAGTEVSFEVRPLRCTAARSSSPSSRSDSTHAEVP